MQPQVHSRCSKHILEGMYKPTIAEMFRNLTHTKAKAQQHPRAWHVFAWPEGSDQNSVPATEVGWTLPIKGGHSDEGMTPSWYKTRSHIMLCFIFCLCERMQMMKGLKDLQFPIHEACAHCESRPWQIVEKY